jgi:prophage maintenance system killer protein
LHLIALHPFIDGQKRTRFQVADNILRMNGLCISAGKDEICNALRRIAEYNCDLNQIERWIRENAVEI